MPLSQPARPPSQKKANTRSVVTLKLKKLPPTDPETVSGSHSRGLAKEIKR